MPGQNNEKPILFSAPMVRAILNGNKTMTRRVVPEKIVEKYYECDDMARSVAMPEGGTRLYEKNVFLPLAKYQPGDRLWVRENYAVSHKFDACRPREIPIKTHVHYAADREYGRDDSIGGLILRPSIFMPRWASRITLEVTNVRVERVQDISEADALAEGVDRTNTSLLGYAQERFKRLWDSINTKRGFGWSKNPWVWVYEFKVVNADAESK